MKTEIEVQDRIRYLLDQEFERRAVEAEVKLPKRCVHNYRHPLDSRKQVNGEPNENYNRIGKNGQTIGLCMYEASSPDDWKGNICEDPIDAQRCPFFTPSITREAIQQALEAQIRDVGWVKDNLPEVHALLWTLDSNKLPVSVPPPSEPKTEPLLPSGPQEEDTNDGDDDVVTPVPPSPVSWWKRALLRLLGIGPHQLPPSDRS
jgi:hypothetical protein